MHSPEQIRAVLDWHVAMGVDETIAMAPVDAFAEPPVMPAPQPSPQQAPAPEPVLRDSQSPAAFTAPPLSQPSAPPLSGEESVKTAMELAAAATSFAELQSALADFDGCALQKTATNLVFTDGNPEGRVLFIGEAPGAEEDRQGTPFVGPSGRLLDKMLASIGLDRSQVLISNTVFWRPPGNRTPTTIEAASCLPFVHRMVELMRPDVIVPLGGPAAKSLLEQSLGIGKLRGRWFSFETPNTDAPIDATPLFHPAYLLRTPAQKRAAWRDLLMIKTRLEEKSSS